MTSNPPPPAPEWPASGPVSEPLDALPAAGDGFQTGPQDRFHTGPQQRVRTGNQPNAMAGIRNLVTGAFRRAGHANIAHARRYYGRNDQRILTLYGYA